MKMRFVFTGGGAAPTLPANHRVVSADNPVPRVGDQIVTSSYGHQTWAVTRVVWAYDQDIVYVHYGSLPEY